MPTKQELKVGGKNSYSASQVVLLHGPYLFICDDGRDRSLHHRADQQGFPILQVSNQVFMLYHPISQPLITILFKRQKITMSSFFPVLRDKSGSTTCI